MVILFRFLFGAILASFMNVVALRYKDGAFLFAKKNTGGRSECPACHARLHWFELIPLVSFAAQFGRCRTCKARISWQYPLVEIIGGLLVVYVPIRIRDFFFLSSLSPFSEYALSVLWIVLFFFLFVLAVIDMRLYMIPDEINGGVVFLGAVIALIISRYAFPVGSSFVGHYALLAGLQENAWLNRIAGMVFGFVFFGILALISRGRGMGLGDVKLSVALGAVFGWPDIVLLTIIAFILGSVFGVAAIVRKKKNLKSVLPFGPFLAVAALVVFFLGDAIIRGYFKLFPIL